jgi:hypothetical protein
MILGEHGATKDGGGAATRVRRQLARHGWSRSACGIRAGTTALLLNSPASAGVSLTAVLAGRCAPCRDTYGRLYYARFPR